MIRTYSDILKFNSFDERFNYLRMKSSVGVETFGFDRFINQQFYTSKEWRSLRDQIILRDNGCDLGMEGYEIYGKIIIHHMNPIQVSDIENASEYLLDPEFLITVSHTTHNAIHFGDSSLLSRKPIERKPNDTCPWRR